MQRCKFACLLGLSLLLTKLVAAQEAAWQLRGFGSLGYAKSDTDKVDIVRDLSQGKGIGYSGRSTWELDSLFGLQLNFQLHDNLNGAVQVISKNSAAYSYQPQLSWAYLNYSQDDQWQFRIGRLGFDTYMLADSRNVGYSYLWARPPIEVFGSLFMSYFDGADVVWQAPELHLKAKLYYGHAKEKTAITDDGEIYSLNHSPMMGVYLDYHHQAWQWRASVAQIRFHDDISSLAPVQRALNNPELVQIAPQAARYARQLSLKEKRIRYYSLGFAYQGEQVELQGMIGRFNTDTALFPDSRSAYLTLGYRIGQFKPYLSASWIRQVNEYALPDIPSGLTPAVDALLLGLKEAKPYNENNQRSLSLGLRYDLNDKSNLKFQIDQLQASRFLLIRKRQNDWDGRARLFSVSYNFIF